MVALALRGLGVDDAMALSYLSRYRDRLQSIDRAPTDYRHWLSEYLDRMSREGADAVLREALPRYISGWARDAYHPLIRLAYGWEFGVLEEAAAGLAYLRSCGADPALEIRAKTMHTTETSAAERFRSMSAVAVTDAQSFDDGLKRVVANRRFTASLIPNNLDSMTRTALDIFASTHDFFALHLVTGSYAFRMVYEFNPSWSALLLEHLGDHLAGSVLSISRQIEIICTTLKAAWRDIDSWTGLTTGAEKAKAQAEFINANWKILRPSCHSEVKTLVLDYALQREQAFNPLSSHLVHGDAHAWNSLAAPVPDAPDQHKFVDPDGLFAEPALDLAISLREWRDDLLDGDALADCWSTTAARFS